MDSVILYILWIKYIIYILLCIITIWLFYGFHFFEQYLLWFFSCISVTFKKGTQEECVLQKTDTENIFLSILYFHNLQ